MEEQRLRKAILLLLAGICTVLGLLWGGAYLALGFPLSGSIPLAYSVVSGGALIYFVDDRVFVDDADNSIWDLNSDIVAGEGSVLPTRQ